MADIHNELKRIQRELRAPKNQFNSFSNFYYRSCEDILEGLKEVMGDCFVLMNDEVVAVGERIYVKATATLHFGEQSISTTAMAREALLKKGMDESQITGSASSYARKYALNGLFAIDDNKDADFIESVEDRLQAVNTVDELNELFKKLDEDKQKKMTKKFSARKKEILKGNEDAQATE